MTETWPLSEFPAMLLGWKELSLWSTPCKQCHTFVVCALLKMVTLFAEFAGSLADPDLLIGQTPIQLMGPNAVFYWKILCFKSKFDWEGGGGSRDATDSDTNVGFVNFTYLYSVVWLLLVSPAKYFPSPTGFNWFQHLFTLIHPFIPD